MSVAIRYYMDDDNDTVFAIRSEAPSGSSAIQKNLPKADKWQIVTHTTNSTEDGPVRIQFRTHFSGTQSTPVWVDWVTISVGPEVDIYSAGTAPWSFSDFEHYGKFVARDGLGAGNTVAATTLGSVTRSMEVFDRDGNSLGFVPIYDSIT